jgi:Rrf2 family protein
MKVSMRVDYGIRVLVDLAQAEGVAQTSDIAHRQGIPEPYLDQILTVLRKAGFIASKRGPQGGHVLARDPSQVSVAEVMAALGNPPSLRCLEQPSDCVQSTLCVQRDVWRQIDEATQKLLAAISIGEMAHQQERRHEGGMYYI